MREEKLWNEVEMWVKRCSDINKSNVIPRPNRKAVISKDDVLNVKILVNANKTVNDFIGA